MDHTPHSQPPIGWLRIYSQALLDPQLQPTALKVALVVGSLLFGINHGAALVRGEMTPGRWVSGLMTFGVPYLVNIHGQVTARSRSMD